MKIPLFITAILIAGCGADGPDDSGTSPFNAECTGLSLELGQGEFGYEPATDGDRFPVVLGPQGGWHIDLAGSVSGSSGAIEWVPNITATSQMAQLGGGGQEGEEFDLTGYDASTCSGVFFGGEGGGRVFIDDVDPGGNYQQFICTLGGQELEITVTITDRLTGETASDTIIGNLQVHSSNNC